MTRIDLSRFFATVLARGHAVVPDTFYETPVYTALTSLQDVERTLTTHGKYYFINETFTHEPLEIRPIERPEGLRFCIMPRDGGQCLDWWHTTGPLEDRQSRVLCAGVLAHYPSYWSIVHQYNERANAELVSEYRWLVRQTKKKSRRGAIGTRTYWICPDARDELQAGRCIMPQFSA